ncbi:amidase domain-containing protein [Streptomyces gilvifuscus]|uniref:Amidase domain-containing protein n=1 Tax=Streptomyces gilvifuscus TaxID=1550617 RepID=A0ABT5G2L8_9ACTN|nr:amidase domain-containing protein [Streptomyces gilvifuscus]MDC2958947.1 amidase domain-containing protein [Streptomyces gilvifuscus]
MRIAQHRRVFAAAVTTTAAMLALIDTPASAQPANLAAPAAVNADTTTLTQLAEGYLQQRADMLTTSRPTVRAAVVQVKATRAMTARTQDDLAALAEKGKRYKEVDGGYTKAQVDVNVTDTTVSGQTATLQLTEHTRLYLPFTEQEVEQGAPEYEELSLPHTVKYTQGTDGAWLLSSDKADTEGGPTPTTQVSDTDADAGTADGGGKADEDEGSKEGPADTTPLPDTGVDDVVKPTVAASYNYNKMVAYADKYWDHHNGAFRTYGNDCTNFISQAMLEGGWGPKGGAIIQRTSNKYWFYGPTTWTTSYTWAGAENWYWFAKKHSKRTKILDNVWKLATSDVLQADWDRNNNIDHTMIVTKKYRGTPYLTYHTGDTHNKSLNKLLSDHPRTWWYAHRT